MKILAIICIVLSLPLSIIVFAQEEPLTVLASTTIIADVARNVGGDLVEVTALIPPDANVHAFNPTPQDIVAVSEADIVLVSGMGLETFLGGLIENAADVQLTPISKGIEALPFADEHHDEEEQAASGEGEDQHEEHLGIVGEDFECEADAHEEEGAEEEEHAEEAHEHGACDPHVWTDPQNVMIWADNIAAAFAAADPTHAEIYTANAEAYKAQLVALDEEIEALLSAIPAEKRVFVTNHEFLGYFAHHYDFEIVGVVLPGGTTLAEPSPQELAELIELIETEGVSAIFVEVSDPNPLSQTIAAEMDRVITLATLYSDSLSSAEGPAGTYLEYMRHNAQVVLDALGD